MKKYMLLSVSFLFVLILSCKEKNKEETSPSAQQMDLVIEIHDEAMDKMGKVRKLAAQLGDKVEADSSLTDHITAKKDLEESHTLMMDWMGGFAERFNGDEIDHSTPLTAEKQVWLNEEEVKIKEVLDKMNKSIANAEALLK